MIYKNFKDTEAKTSLLGYGCMRMPTLGGPGDPVDRVKGQELIDYAYAHGVNYFDTAYPYHGGDSEKFIGEALAKYPRDTWFLATKLPGFQLKTHDDVVRIFNEQLEKCGVEYFDFYLCHGIGDENMGPFLDPEIGAIPFLQQMKAEGKIKRLGFSSHASPEGLEKFIKAGNWDFAQIQLNYLDWEYQNAKRQYEILTEYGLPVIVMEPCRGGRLASLCDEANDILKASAPERSIASWAFRWIQSRDNVQVCLSGMTTMEQLKDNLAVFDEYDKLSAEEEETLQKAKTAFLTKFQVPCTACRYCSACPKELDIPEILSAYNDVAITDNVYSRGGTIKALISRGEKYEPLECVGCGTCQRACPQNIDTPKIMADFAKIIAEIPKQFK